MVFSVRIGYLRLAAALVLSIRVSALIAAVRRCTGFRHVTTELVLVVKYSLLHLRRSLHYRANQRNHITDHRRPLADTLDSCYSRFTRAPLCSHPQSQSTGHRNPRANLVISLVKVYAHTRL